MLRALTTAATGMIAQQNYLDVIANNVANVNTTAFKKSRIEFQDLLSQATRTPGALMNQGTYQPVGIEIGLGVKTAATINLATGAATATGNATEVTPYLENGQYRALIVPQTTAEGALVVVTVDGVDYTLTRAMTFKANKQHKFTVTLNKVSNGVNVGIGGWETDEEDYGGSAE